jgi:(2R)-ethylmalonyl-CoA mutase
MSVDARAEGQQIERLKVWREARDQQAVDKALSELRAAATEDRNVMEPSIACAHAGVTTGEWGQTLRDVYGEYRAPTGISGSATSNISDIEIARSSVEAASKKLGRRLKILVGKPGLDGHSNGAEQIAVRARDAGIEVVYEGIRLTPAEIVDAALQENVHVVGLSILSGSHVSLVQDILDLMKAKGIEDVPVVIGGIIPDKDAETLRAAGVRRVYTPKDFDLTAIIADIADIATSRS